MSSLRGFHDKNTAQSHRIIVRHLVDVCGYKYISQQIYSIGWSYGSGHPLEMVFVFLHANAPPYMGYRLWAPSSDGWILPSAYTTFFHSQKASMRTLFEVVVFKIVSSYLLSFGWGMIHFVHLTHIHIRIYLLAYPKTSCAITKWIRSFMWKGNGES